MNIFIDHWMTRFWISYCPHKILLALASGQVDIHNPVRATYSSLCVKSCYVFIVHQNLGCICSFGLIYIVFSNTFGTSIQLKKNPLTFSYRYRPWNVLLFHLKSEWAPSERWLQTEQNLVGAYKQWANAETKRISKRKVNVLWTLY